MNSTNAMQYNITITNNPSVNRPSDLSRDSVAGRDTGAPLVKCRTSDPPPSKELTMEKRPVKKADMPEHAFRQQDDPEAYWDNLRMRVATELTADQLEAELQ